MEAQLSNPFPPPGVKSAIAINCMFTAQAGMRESQSTNDVQVLDNMPDGCLRYYIGVPSNLAPGHYSFALTARITWKNNQRQPILIRSRAPFEVISAALETKFTSITPASVVATEFAHARFRVAGTHLDRINEEQFAFLNQPNLGRMRIRLTGSTTSLVLTPIPASPGGRGALLTPGRYRVLAFKRSGNMCLSSVYLEIE